MLWSSIKSIYFEELQESLLFLLETKPENQNSIILEACFQVVKYDLQNKVFFSGKIIVTEEKQQNRFLIQ